MIMNVYYTTTDEALSCKQTGYGCGSQPLHQEVYLSVYGAQNVMKHIIKAKIKCSNDFDVCLSVFSQR